MNTTTPEKCPKCRAELLRENEGLVQFMCGSMKKARYMGLKIETAICTGSQRDQLAERIKELEDEVADYMKLFCDWKAYATNLESAGKQMLDGGFHAPHIISQWREAEDTRP